MTANIGDRIELLSMVDDPCPIPAGATGTVDAVFPQPAQPHAGRGPWVQYSVKWDAPHERRTLMVISPPDQFKVLNANHLPS